MSCNRFETEIIDLGRGDKGAPESTEQAIAHVGSCSRCAAALADQQRLTSNLKAFAWNTRAASAPSRVEEQLRAAFREATAGSNTFYGASRRATSRFRIAVAAAVVLLALAGSYYRFRPGSGPLSGEAEQAAVASKDQQQAGDPVQATIVQRGSPPSGETPR